MQFCFLFRPFSYLYYILFIRKNQFYFTTFAIFAIGLVPFAIPPIVGVGTPPPGAAGAPLSVLSSCCCCCCNSCSPKKNVSKSVPVIEANLYLSFLTFKD